MQVVMLSAVENLSIGHFAVAAVISPYFVSSA